MIKLLFKCYKKKNI